MAVYSEQIFGNSVKPMKKLMKKILAATLLGSLTAFAADPALTIYNQNFGIVREVISLDLKAGVNQVSFADATAHLEPDSVILRDPAGKRQLRILEQNFRGDPVSQELLLSLFEGKVIEFESFRGPNAEPHRFQGKIIRSGYVPHYSAMNRYGRQYYQTQTAYSSGAAGQPIIEVDGKLRFGLPGQPIFPSLPNDTILKPTLHWQIQTDSPGKFDAELGYLTGGMRWEADYNIVAPEKGDLLDLTGWVTIDNQSGKSFQNAKIKLMAGDVSRIQPDENIGERLYAGRASMSESSPAVTEKTFDEYHLYTLERQATLLDRQTKQVEFTRAAGVKSQTVYVYDGAKIDRNRYRGWNWENIRADREYGSQSNPKVWVMREFTNSANNKLGIALPKGRVRFYRRDTGGQLEFIGENMIDHTPRNEVIRVFTGDAFDLVGQRTRTNFRQGPNNDNWLEESFEITLRNRKEEAVEIRVIEHLYRWTNWEVRNASDKFEKKDAQTVEFRIKLDPGQEKKVTYTAHYSW